METVHSASCKRLLMGNHAHKVGLEVVLWAGDCKIMHFVPGGNACNLSVLCLMLI